MPARDFWPLSAHSGGHHVVRYGKLNASESFREGEMVFINGDGEIAELNNDDSKVIVGDMQTSQMAGVAAMDGDTARNDGFARSTGDLISYWPINEGTLFITKNYISAADTSAIPPGTIVGESFQVHGSDATTLTANWEILSTAGVAGVDMQALVHDVLNVRKEPITASDTTTGVWVVFELISGIGAA